MSKYHVEFDWDDTEEMEGEESTIEDLKSHIVDTITNMMAVKIENIVITKK